MITRRSFINLGLLTLVSLIWGSQFPVYKHAADHMSDSALSFYVFIFAIGMLLPFLIRERRAARVAVKPRSPRSSGSDLTAWSLLGISVLPASIGTSWGIEHSSGSNGAILYLTIPILMLIIAVPILGERLTWARVFTLLLALIGTFFVSRGDLAGGDFSRQTLLGNLAILSGCVGSAFFNIYSRRVLERHTELELLIYTYAVAALLCAVASLCTDTRHFYDVAGIPASTWLAIAALGGLVWGVSTVLYMWLVTRLDVGQVSVSIYQQSFFGVLLSAALLGDRLRAAQVVGGLTVAVATLLADSHERRAAKEATSTSP
jgi:drug/metabolite transporter (DMT)-like permease